MTNQADLFQRGFDAALFADAVYAAVKNQILPNRQLIIQRKFLRHISGAGAHFFALCERVKTQYRRFAIRWLQKSKQHADGGGLARTVWSEIADYFARLD